MIAIVFIAMVAAVIWGAVFYRWSGLLGGCLAILLMGCCFGHPFFHANLGPLPVTLDRALLAVLLVLFVFSRRMGRVSLRPLDPHDFVLLAYIGLLTVSTLTHDWQAHGHRALATLLFFYLMPLALYLVVRDSPLSARGVRGIFATLAAFGAYLAMTAVFESYHVWSLVFPRYIVSDAFPEFLGRGRGPLLNPVGNGLFLCVGVYCLLTFWPRATRGGRLLLAIVTMVYVAGIYCTLTRVVWLAAALGIPVLVVMNLPRRWRLVFVTAVTLTGFIGVAWRWNDLTAFKRDEHVSVHEMSQSASLRPILAYVAWQMFLDRPLTGCGLRQYEDNCIYYLSDRSTSLVLERARRYVQHNVFLALLVETGLLGLGLFLLILALWFRSAWQLWRSAGAAIEVRQFGLVMFTFVVAYIVMGMFHDLAIIPMVNMLLFFLAGVTRSLAGEARCFAPYQSGAVDCLTAHPAYGVSSAS